MFEVQVSQVVIFSLFAFNLIVPCLSLLKPPMLQEETSLKGTKFGPKFKYAFHVTSAEEGKNLLLQRGGKALQFELQAFAASQ